MSAQVSAGTTPSPEENHKMGQELVIIWKHWQQLEATNEQELVVVDMFHKLLRTSVTPLNSSNMEQIFAENGQFQSHCRRVQYAITNVTTNLGNVKMLAKNLCQMGSHHFYYDVYEPHIEVLEECFMSAIADYPLEDGGVIGGEEAQNAVQSAWKEIWKLVKACFNKGIMDQRNKYLSSCITNGEMGKIRATWKKVVEHGRVEAGKSLCAAALQAYTALMKGNGLEMPLEIGVGSGHFEQFAADTLEMLNVTIESYEDGGFASLPPKMKDYVAKYVVLEVCPTLVRKAFFEGLIDMLNYVVGESDMGDDVQAAWNKLYRVMEHATMAAIVHF